MFRCNQSNHPCFLLATPYAHRQGSKILCLGKILICQKSIVLDFDILIVRQELPDLTRHVTRQRARPPMPPFQKLGHCTNMLHSNLHHMTTLFPISINDYNKTGYLVYCFYNLHILLHLSGYVSLVDHHVNVRVGWGALWLPSIFPP